MREMTSHMGCCEVLAQCRGRLGRLGSSSSCTVSARFRPGWQLLDLLDIDGMRSRIRGPKHLSWLSRLANVASKACGMCALDPHLLGVQGAAPHPMVGQLQAATQPHAWHTYLHLS